MRFFVVLCVALSLVSCSRDPNVAKQRYLENGNKYFEREKYKEAVIMYRNALQKDQRFGPAYYRLALAELKLSRFGSAVAALRRAVELIPKTSGEHWDAAVRLSEIYLLANRNTNADKQAIAEVEKTIEALLQRDPNSFDGHRLAGDLQFTRGGVKFQEKKREEGQELFRVALASYRKASSVKPEAVPVLIQIARTELALGQVADAERSYRAVIGKDKRQVQVYLELYRIFLASQRPEPAEQTLKEAIAANPKEFQLLAVLATHYYGMRRRDDMVKTLNEIKSHAKDYDQAFLTVGDLYYRVGEMDEAVRQYREGIAADPKKKAQYQKRIIEVLMRQDKPRDADEVATAILKDNPNDSDARSLKAGFLLERGEVARAITELQAIVTRSPENPVFRLQLGKAHAARGEAEQARQQFTKAVELRPDYLPAHLSLAELQLVKREFESVLKTVQAIRARDKDNVRARLLESAALMSQEKLADSRALLTDMAARYPTSPDVQFQLGTLGLAERKFHDAEASFRRSFQLEPSNVRGLLGLVETALAQGKPDEAIRLLQAEAEKAPTRADLKIALGNVSVRTGRYDMGVAEFQKALSLLDKSSKSASDVYLRIGETYRRKGDHGAAVTYLQKAREIDPVNPVILTNLGLTLDAAVRRPEARQVYEAALKIDPTNAVVLNNLAFLLAQTGTDLDQALTLAQRAKQLLPTVAEVSDTLGWIYLKKNLSDHAISIFREIVAKVPAHPTYRYHLGLALAQKGDKLQALKELREALKNNPDKEEKNDIQALIAKIG
jgi:tetratricopeptide (TPR) repeat protein